MNKSLNQKGSAENKDLPDKNDVLLSLWKNAKWLEHKATGQGKVSDKDYQRTHMIQTHAYVCKTILFGLKDIELELRVAELENKLKGGAIISCQH